MTPFLGVAGLGGAGGNSRKLPTPPEDTWISLSGISHWSSSDNLAVDNDKNTFTWGKHTNLHSQGGSYSFWIIKFDSDGIPAWHRGIGGAGNEYNNEYTRNITTDSSGSVYVMGYSNSTTGTSTGDRRAILIKWNSSGTLQYKKLFTMSGTTQSYGNMNVVDDSDNVWVSGRHYDGNTMNSIGFIAKLNSNGNLAWVKDYNDFVMASDMVFDSSGNAYCIGRIGASNQDEGLVMKIDTSGNIQWSSIFGTTTGTVADYCRAIGMDSSGNLYVAGSIGDPYAGGNQYAFLSKFNSSGTYQWTKSIGQTEAGSTGETQTHSLIVYNDTIYVCGRTTGLISGQSVGFLIAFNTSGDQQWSRYFGRGSGSSSGSVTATGLDAATNYLYVSLSQTVMDHVPNAGSKAHTVFKIPSDGTKTGIYTYTGQSVGNGFDFVYGTSSLSTSNYTSHATSGLNNSSVSLYTTQTTSISSTSNLTEYYNATQNIGIDQTSMTGYHKIDIP
tara:strand:- start:839 stop:2332 length:1494 start_codon:yes stop_codon:yes gene_type:complete